jgi:MoaA/NifB/PqqE/SkfB family radical SAM enzyme
MPRARLSRSPSDSLGNINETPFTEIWHGATNHRWRVAHSEDRYDDSGPYCSRCNWRSAGAMPHEKVLAYLEKTGEHDAATSYRERWGITK